MFSTHLENFLLFSTNLKLWSANCFNLDQSKILSSGNGLNLDEAMIKEWLVFCNNIYKRDTCMKVLTHYHTTNFRLFRNQRVCRQQFQIWRKWKKNIQTGRKHCGKRRNWSLWAISPFLTVFSKGFRGIKVSLCGNGFNIAKNWLNDNSILRDRWRCLKKLECCHSSSLCDLNLWPTWTETFRWHIYSLTFYHTIPTFNDTEEGGF